MQKMNDNKFNYEELRNALILIQNVCLDVNDCEKCPFGGDFGECLITTISPSDWRFTDPIPVIRLLK